MAAEWLGSMLTPLHFIRRSGGGRGEGLGKGCGWAFRALRVITGNWIKEVMAW